MLEAATLLFFPALMVFAAISDLLTLTISNRISIALAVLFISMAFACALPATEILWHLACGTAMLIFAFGLFARGWIGGGDAKLAAATAIWVGFDHLGDYALSASALGGLLTVSIIVLRKWPLPGVLLAGPASLMWPFLVVAPDPFIKIGLQGLDRSVELLAERDTVELVEDGRSTQGRASTPFRRRKAGRDRSRDRPL